MLLCRHQKQSQLPHHRNSAWPNQHHQRESEVSRSIQRARWNANKLLAVSKHSRAAKRASSPSIDTDKSLKEIKAPHNIENRPSVLAIHQGAGVSKKSKNGRKAVLSAKAKRRQEKGMDRAEALMDQKSTRIEKSKNRARNVQERAKAWEELNKKIMAEQAAKDIALAEADGWVDEDGEAVMEDAQTETKVSKAIKTVPAKPAAALVVSAPPAAMEEDEEIL